MPRVLSLFFLIEEVFRKLGENNSHENEATAQKFGTGEPLVEQQPAEEQGEGRLQTHNQGCGSGFQMLLADDLQAECNTHGQDTCITQRQPAVEDVFPDGGLRQEHGGGGQNGGHDGLDAVDPETVKAAGQLIHQRDLHRKTQGAAQQKQVAFVNFGNTHTAQQIKTGHGNGNTDPCGKCNLLSEEKTQNGYQHDIHGGNKACLAGGGILDAKLLEAGGNEQNHTAEQTRFPQLHIGPGFKICFFVLIKQVHHRYQEKDRQGASDSLEGKRTDIVHAHTLGYKCGAPDDRCDQQKEATFEFFFHKITVSEYIIKGLILQELQWFAF